jgi:hypothetical protein
MMSWLRNSRAGQAKSRFDDARPHRPLGRVAWEEVDEAGPTLAAQDRVSAAAPGRRRQRPTHRWR